MRDLIKHDALITRRTRCFQVGDYAKISVSTTG